MENMARRPELFTDENIAFETGVCRERRAITVPVTKEGLYNGNGQYRHSTHNKRFHITGFDKLTDEWFGRGYIEVEKKSI